MFVRNGFPLLSIVLLMISSNALALGVDDVKSQLNVYRGRTPEAEEISAAKLVERFDARELDQVLEKIIFQSSDGLTEGRWRVAHRAFVLTRKAVYGNGGLLNLLPSSSPCGMYAKQMVRSLLLKGKQVEEFQSLTAPEKFSLFKKLVTEDDEVLTVRMLITNLGSPTELVIMLNAEQEASRASQIALVALAELLRGDEGLVELASILEFNERKEDDRTTLKTTSTLFAVRRIEEKILSETKGRRYYQNLPLTAKSILVDQMLEYSSEAHEGRDWRKTTEVLKHMLTASEISHLLSPHFWRGPGGGYAPHRALAQRLMDHLKQEFVASLCSTKVAEDSTSRPRSRESQ